MLVIRLPICVKFAESKIKICNKIDHFQGFPSVKSEGLRSFIGNYKTNQMAESRANIEEIWLLVDKKGFPNVVVTSERSFPKHACAEVQQ